MNSTSAAAGAGQVGAIGWLCVQFALNCALLLLTTSGVVADMLHIAQSTLTQHLPWCNPSLKLLEEGEDPDGLDESEGLTRGPSRPVVFSQVRNCWVLEVYLSGI